MDIKDLSNNGYASEKRLEVSSTKGSVSNVSAEDNSPVMMNKPGLASRGSRADELIEMAGDDSYRLGTEAPRRAKMKG